MLAGAAPLRAETAAPTPLNINDQSAPSFRVYTSEHGLSDEIWSTVGFDRDGFVWAGSASALARFDGYRWRLWDVPQGRSLVRDMESSADGTLWALFESEGLARYDGQRWTLDPSAPGSTHRFAQVHAGSGERALWLTNDLGGYMRWRDGQWERPLAHVPNPSGSLLRIEQTEHLYGRPLQWMGTTDGGLWMRELADPQAHWQRFDHPVIRQMYLTDLRRIEVNGVEELWVISYNGGVARLRDEQIRIWRSASGELPTEAMYSALDTVDADGASSIWIASRAGLIRIRGDVVTTYDRRHGLPSDAVRGIKLDRSPDGVDLLWLATEGGIARLALTQSQWLTVSLLGANNNGTFGMLLEPDGGGGERLWVGSSTEGLGLLQDGRWRYFGTHDGTLPVDSVRAIWRLSGPDGQPWRLLSLSGSAQLFRIEEDLSLTDLNPPWLEGPEQTATDALVRMGPDGHEFWFANLRSGIHRWQGSQWRQYSAEGGSESWTVLKLAEQLDAQGRSWLWAATDQGLARYDGERWQVLPPQPGLPSDLYRWVSVRGDVGSAVLWAGTQRNGVVRLDVTDPLAPKAVNEPALPPMPDPTVYSVLFDSKQRAYVCTNNGVQQLTPDARGGYRARVFSRRDGMVHDECNTNSQHIDGSDRYWVGTLGGLSVYDPNLQPPTTRIRPKSLHWTELRVAGVQRAPTEADVPAGVGLVLPAGSRELRIGYTLLAGLREDESVYRSQLVGYDPDFSDWTAERERSYTGLPPGAYRFVLEARDYSGTASSPLELSFEVAPHWWQRNWVQGALALLVLALAAAAVMLYNRNLRLRQRQLEVQVAERTVELHGANQRLTELSYQDPLTGVANRRRLMEAIAAAIERASGRGLPIGLIVIDVDHFKDYNDRHGHLAGDVALRAVAQALASATRGQDLIARFGGEEFACLMVDADLATVARVAERMRALVEALPPRTLGNDSQTITLSAGICARVPSSGTEASELLDEADAALYRAKHEGRNCVRSALRAEGQ
jgi:diguanylate cyclase (GGDEF)-like protein